MKKKKNEKIFSLFNHHKKNDNNNKRCLCFTLANNFRQFFFVELKIYNHFLFKTKNIKKMKQDQIRLHSTKKNV